MASTIKVNNIQNQCGANIANKCGSTITLGASGDTITLACGASQTGFGRTGTVDWDTTAKTASFTAVSGNGYFVNTTSGAITVTLPATPSAGDIVAIKDYANTADTNNIIIARNGSNIDGGTTNPLIQNEGGSITLVYVDATKGWLIVEAAQKSDLAFPTYIVATGGTITTCGDFKIHTFTGPGTFTVCSIANPVGGPNAVDYLVVAGAGAGGNNGGGGGGAGGFRVSNSLGLPAPTTSPLANPTGITATATSFPITVGAGGAGLPNAPPQTLNNGSNSVFSTITSAGGGAGGINSNCTGNLAASGGSGGGGAVVRPCSPSNGAGSGNTPPVSPPQGQDGGTGHTPYGAPFGGGGGGGAGAAGNPAPAAPAGVGDGGVGSFISPSFAVGCAGTPGPVGSTRYFAGGGRGGTEHAPGAVGSGGAGGGGAGSSTPTGLPATSGTTNTGGGGGGGGGSPASSGSGGSGIVIIRYKYQ